VDDLNGGSAASNCGAPSLSLLRYLSGVVFVQTNAAEHNKIIAFERASNGTLSNAGEFDTGGRGSGGVNGPLESQGSVKLSQDHSFLFAVNAGNGTVSVFGVHHTNLVLLEKVPSGGSQPVAVAQHTTWCMCSTPAVLEVL
jgi:6-phosphogluconolactonase